MITSMLMRIIGDSTSTRVLMGDLFLSSHCRHSMACREAGKVFFFRSMPDVGCCTFRQSGEA